MEYELPKLLRAWADYLTEEVRVVPAAIKMTEAANRIEQLEEALGKYGWHESKCDHFSGHNCSCGWDDVCAALGEKKE